MKRRPALPWLLVIILSALLIISALGVLAATTFHTAQPTAPPVTETAPTTSAPTGAGVVTSPTPDPQSTPETKGKSSRGEEPMSAAAQSARPGQGPLPSDHPVSCPAPTKTVSTAADLESALANAVAGDVIALADGTYPGNFSTKNSGAASNRIYLCGGPGAVLDAGGNNNGYVFHLDSASYWVLSGFTVRNGQKGIVTDSSTGSVIEDLTVTDVGDEAIHLRKNSSSNLVTGNTITRTGSKNPKFGEGIYVGTAVSNWCTISDCHTDQSNYNIIANNTISHTTAENIDIKEGTIGGVIKNNHLDGTGMTDATAWINVKGNAWTIDSNDGQNSPGDGYQTHNILQDWGDYNLFTHNSGPVGGPGYGVALRPAMHNTVSCSNTLTARSGLATIACTNT
ncbi:right-handed parallel beta-helix repeat-containing protein [Pseudarthrobacter sp. NPDC080039]|uniref:right-handed parallel beta-helix repeat-containing protein n=1 Tax=unclassified Pseudarthrobacter TaxID=2647000 RepID=UPI003450E8BF